MGSPHVGSIRRPISQFVCQLVSFSVSLSVSKPTGQYIRLSVYSSVFVPFCLSVCSSLVRQLSVSVGYLLF